MGALSPSLLKEITTRLVQEFLPEEIILFGSHAWGAPDADSDVDLCVIVSDSDEKPTRRAARAYKSLRGLNAPVDILVKTRAGFDRLRPVHASLELELMERGKRLYG